MTASPPILNSGGAKSSLAANASVLPTNVNREPEPISGAGVIDSGALPLNVNRPPAFLTTALASAAPPNLENVPEPG